jgi:hypothetical protein
MAAVISLTVKYFLGFWLFDATMFSSTLTTDWTDSADTPFLEFHERRE